MESMAALISSPHSEPIGGGLFHGFNDILGVLLCLCKVSSNWST